VRIAVRPVAIDRPWAWLAAGWQDLQQARTVSLAYGAALVGLSWLLTLVLLVYDAFYFILPLTAGFFLVAPILATGLYDVSRRLAAGEAPTLVQSLGAWRRNGMQIGWLAAILLLIHLAWFRLATLLYALFFVDVAPAPTIAHLLETVLFSRQSLAFLFVGAASGAILAAATFAIAVVSIPMLIDRDVSALTAIAASLRAVQVNLRPLALWAVLIVMFTGFALVPFFLGLAVVMPLIAHASWYAYKDMIE